MEHCSKLCKGTTKSVCVHGISYFSARAFLCQRAGTARERSWFACMGDFLFKLLCLYRIFNVEYNRQEFIKMLDVMGNEKSPNHLFNGNKNLFSSSAKAQMYKLACTNSQILSKHHKMEEL